MRFRLSEHYRTFLIKNPVRIVFGQSSLWVTSLFKLTPSY